MKKESFRTMCLVIGFIGMIFTIISNAGTAATIVGVSISLILIAFAYAVTSSWGHYLIGEPGEGQQGSMGG